MEYVFCWCCENFVLSKENKTDPHKDLYGICEIYNIERLAMEDVCKNFILRSGLHTKRIIPDFSDDR